MRRGVLRRRYAAYPAKMTVRWVDPSGAVVRDTPVKPYASSYVGSLLELPAPGATASGTWTAETRFEDEVLERRSFRIQPSR